MVDLGLFNFVKNGLARGQTKEELFATLQKAGWNTGLVEEAYEAVEQNRPPESSVPTDRAVEQGARAAERFGRPTSITMVCGYYFIGIALAIINVAFLAATVAAQTSFSFSPISFSMSSLPGLVITSLLLVSLFGYWDMRKWGVFLYLLTIVGSVIYTLSRVSVITTPVIESEILGLFLPVFVLYIGFAHLSEMS